MEHTPPSDPDPRHAVESLDRQECLRLLGTVSIGRVGFTADALPTVEPVAFVLRGEEVVVRARPGSSLELALRGDIVAFEADDLDQASRTGWTVTGIGPATVVTDPDRLAELAELPLQRWVADGQQSFGTISMAILHGRRVTTNGRPPADRQ